MSTDPEFDRFIQRLVRCALLVMALVIFVVSVVSVVAGTYGFGVFTVVALAVFTLVGLWSSVEVIRLPFGIEIRLRRKRDD
jgi:hypothetical protein